MKYFIFLSVFFCAGFVFSQDLHPPMAPGRTITTEPQKSYSDSAEFAKLFKEFYPVIKPAKSLKEQSEQYFQMLSRSFAMQGIDSAEAAKAAFKNLDEKAFEKIYFDTYRRNLSAKELKKYMEFIKTPEGKHIAEVWSNLQRCPADANMYMARTINVNLTPIRQAAREKMEKEHPGQKMMGAGAVPPQLHAAPVDVFDQKNAGSKDSLMRMHELQNKLPKSIDSLATPHLKQ
jgi:hypothetical protein